MKERGLFVIWEKGRVKETEILSDIEEHFLIDETFEVSIDNNFDEIINEFYQYQIPPGEIKSQKCGAGPFLVVVVTDPKPIYEMRRTLRAEKCVEINFFDAKKRYRAMVANGDRFCIAIHGTNNAIEFEHDYNFLKRLRRGRDD